MGVRDGVDVLGGQGVLGFLYAALGLLRPAVSVVAAVACSRCLARRFVLLLLLLLSAGVGG